ncbi:hypothetical protein Poli38472_008523 [Pythium oligandrum]|uniref:Uncharacterized protein n=1 Tax=Pythium oligandrum TaxID=41045 RepID=A0A8K1FA44_PYTOL|nr:hypothetical protein Poli38472_008523 [Pythium oligandrum]|eukprot:TMW55875.1 hypothetical protein Poli38472_008523 [Pythium oligandrum]
MSLSSNPWGTAVTAEPQPVKLHDVMDEELAAKLQREEEEEWEREISAQFGDEHVGWCFVEVPSADNEFGAMSVVQQEISIGQQDGDPDDPDYALALELQAQEAEQYDRLRRQEASSIERIRVMQQDPPKPRQLRHFLPGAATRPGRTVPRQPSTSSSSGFTVPIDEEYPFRSDDEDEHDEYANGEAQEDLDRDEEDMYLEDDLPIRKFNALDITLRGSERQHRGGSSQLS